MPQTKRKRSSTSNDNNATTPSSLEEPLTKKAKLSPKRIPFDSNVLVYIFTFVEVPFLVANCSSVCKQFYDAIWKTPTIWKNVMLRLEPKHDQLLSKVGIWIKGLAIVDEKLENHAILDLVAAKCQNLGKFNCSHWPISMRILPHLKNLEQLVMSCNNAAATPKQELDKILLPNLTRLTLALSQEPNMMWLERLVSSSNKIRKIELLQYAMNNQDFDILAKHCAHLEAFSLHNQESEEDITDGLSKFLHACKLKELDLRFVRVKQSIGSQIQKYCKDTLEVLKLKKLYILPVAAASGVYTREEMRTNMYLMNNLKIGSFVDDTKRPCYFFFVSPVLKKLSMRNKIPLSFYSDLAANCTELHILRIGHLSDFLDDNAEEPYEELGKEDLTAILSKCTNLQCLMLRVPLKQECYACFSEVPHDVSFLSLYFFTNHAQATKLLPETCKNMIPRIEVVGTMDSDVCKSVCRIFNNAHHMALNCKGINLKMLNMITAENPKCADLVLICTEQIAEDALHLNVNNQLQFLMYKCDTSFLHHVLIKLAFPKAKITHNPIFKSDSNANLTGKAEIVARIKAIQYFLNVPEAEKKKMIKAERDMLYKDTSELENAFYNVIRERYRVEESDNSSSSCVIS